MTRSTAQRVLAPSAPARTGANATDVALEEWERDGLDYSKDIEQLSAFADRWRNAAPIIAMRVDRRVVDLRSAIAFDENEWRNALRANTAEGYRAYLERVKGGSHEAEAAEQLYYRDEDYAWSVAVSYSTRAALQQFIVAWPQSAHASEARSQLRAGRGFFSRLQLPVLRTPPGHGWGLPLRRLVAIEWRRAGLGLAAGAATFGAIVLGWHHIGVPAVDVGLHSGDVDVVSERGSARSAPGEKNSAVDATGPAVVTPREIVATTVDDAQPAAVVARKVPVVAASPVAIRVVALLDAGEGSIVSDHRPGLKAILVSSPSYSVQALSSAGGEETSPEVVEEQADPVVEAKAPAPVPRAVANAGARRHARKTTTKGAAVVAETSDRWVEKFYRDY